ncbi:hypothetical protein K0M31_012464 [Melipona bicolor]|uniref:Uncharacterized protein n=1 Tax=Melipona bicolor TaxID=60889 RepID=A0AA40KHH5_9HYME|nr:hypothetical protein K0M31_012464 [Melipona bicolor]
MYIINKIRAFLFVLRSKRLRLAAYIESERGRRKRQKCPDAVVSKVAASITSIPFPSVTGDFVCDWHPFGASVCLWLNVGEGG